MFMEDWNHYRQVRLVHTAGCAVQIIEEGIEASGLHDYKHAAWTVADILKCVSSAQWCEDRAA
jgi:hypothetical protein